MKSTWISWYLFYSKSKLNTERNGFKKSRPIWFSAGHCNTVWKRWMEMWFSFSYFWDAALTTSVLLSSQNAAFFILWFSGSTQEQRQKFCWISSWLTKQEKQSLFLLMAGVCFTNLCVSLCSQRLPYAYDWHKNYIYTVLTSKNPRSKFQKEYLALWIGLNYFSYLPYDTNAVSVWFS